MQEHIFCLLQGQQIKCLLVYLYINVGNLNEQIREFKLIVNCFAVFYKIIFVFLRDLSPTVTYQFFKHVCIDLIVFIFVNNEYDNNVFKTIPSLHVIFFGMCYCFHHNF